VEAASFHLASVSGFRIRRAFCQFWFYFTFYWVVTFFLLAAGYGAE
jgi:hypothetical protein